MLRKPLHPAYVIICLQPPKTRKSSEIQAHSVTAPFVARQTNQERSLEARGGERKLAGLPVVCCWCCCCWCCCCRCCAGRCCAGCSAGAGSSAAAAAGAGWSAAAAAAALGMGMLLLLLPPLGGLLLLLLLLPLLRWAQMLGVLQLLGGPAHRAQGGVEPRGGGGSIRLILLVRKG